MRDDGPPAAAPVRCHGRYESAFANWEKCSSVRTKPQRRMQDTEGSSRLFFPPESVPAAGHPLVASRGTAVRDRLLVHALYQYLHFTTVLEQTAVLPVTARISLGRSGIELPAEMRRDAFKITTDEAWHAQFSYEFLQDVTRVTGIQPTALVEPQFVRDLAVLRENTEPSDRTLVDLFFAVVSETLISRLLADIPGDRRLPAPVCAVVRDHALDEGRHHGYFRSFLHVLWPELSPAKRRHIGTRVPDFVRIFLQADRVSAARMLAASGLTAAEAARVVGERYSPRARAGDLPSAARGTVRAFRDVGAFGDRAIHDAFACAGLLAAEHLDA